jgi:hypothetical protein
VKMRPLILREPSLLPTILTAKSTGRVKPETKARIVNAFNRLADSAHQITVAEAFSL